MARFNYQGELSRELQDVICPLTVTQNVIAGRWKIVILWHLSQRKVIRFNEFQRLLSGISKGILTRQLRELEDDEIIHREVYKEVPPKVEYSLTAQGEKFIPVLEAMQIWGQDLLQRKIEKHQTELDQE